MIVYLVDWKDSVSRAVRVAHSFGADEVCLVGSTPEPKYRHLHSAKSIPITRGDGWPDDALVLERRGKIPLQDVPWATAKGLVVGGASVDLPVGPWSARIEARRPPLVGDQALAVALWCRQLHLSGCRP